MKKIIALLSMAVLSFSVVLTATAADSNVLGELGDPANVVLSTNQSNVDSWYYWNQDGKNGSYSIVDKEKADGTTGKVWLSDHIDGMGSNASLVISKDKLKANTEYVFAAMIMVNDATNPAGAGQGSWLIVRGSGLNLSSSPVGLASADTWTQKTVEFTTPETLTENVMFRWVFMASPGKAWAYDFKVVEKKDFVAYQPPVTSNEPEQSEDDKKPDDDKDDSSETSFVIANPSSKDSSISSASDGDSENGFPWLWAIIGGGVVLAGAVVAVYFLKFKKK